jgi:tRNA threonylcarbamoyladenosine biosynthesis protein TsaB
MPSPQREYQQRMTVVLAFDCAVSGLGVAVVHDGAVLASLREEGREQAARLLPAIAAAMDQAGVARGALSMVAVTTGPGSFTGVRVGLATARGLAMALGIPLAGVATTAVLLAQADAHANADGRIVVAAVDSHLGDWFCAIRAGDSTPFLASTEDLVRRLEGKPCLVVGPEAAVLAPLLPNAEVSVALPDPVVLARLAIEAGVEGWRARNQTEGLPRPLYLRGVNITLPDGARRTVDG